MNNQASPGEQGSAAPMPSPEERAAAAFSNFMGFEERPQKGQKMQKEAPSGESDAVQQQQQADEQSTEATDAATGDEGGDTANEPTAEEFFEFEANGKRYQIPKELESNFLQHKDYTQKTQAVAEQRKTFESLTEQARIAGLQMAFQQEVAQELNQLQAFDAVLQQQNQIDWSSMSTDEILKRKIQIDQWKEQRDTLQAQLQGKYQEFAQKRDAAIKDLRKKANDVAAQRIPGWNEALQKAVREHAVSEGYTEAELENAGLDPRHWVTLWKAHQFDQLKAKATKTVNEVRSVKTTPANPMPQHVKDKLAFNKQVQKTAPGSSERARLVEQRVASLFSR